MAIVDRDGFLTTKKATQNRKRILPLLLAAAVLFTGSAAGSNSTGSDSSKSLETAVQTSAQQEKRQQEAQVMAALYKEARLAMAQQQAAMPQSAKFEHPNHFVLTGKRDGKTIRVAYDTDSITGNAILSYDDRTFTGKEIKTQDIEIGTLVSVLLNKSTTFSLLLPRFSKKESAFKTIAITAFAPLEVDQVYQVDELRGKAQEVQYLKATSDAAKRPLKVTLGLVWVHGNVYRATVTVTVLDSCYAAGDLHLGLPPGQVGIPEMEYLTFELSHKGEFCGQIVRTIEKTIDVKFSSAKPKLTAFAVVNGEVVGQATKPFPKKK